MAKEEEKKKKGRFERFVDRFAPGPNTDYLDSFTLVGLLIYGALKATIKTRRHYRKWKDKNRMLSSVQRKVNSIRASRVRNAEKATSLDQLSPEAKKQAKDIVRQMRKDKSKILTGRDEASVIFDVAKELQVKQEMSREQNRWVDGFKNSVERELTDEIINGKKPGFSRQFTPEYIDYVNNDPRWFYKQANDRANQYVNELTAEDPSLKGRENELIKQVWPAALEQASVDRQVYNDFYKWQTEKRQSIMEEVLQQGRNMPENKSLNESLQNEVKEPQNEAPQKEQGESEKPENAPKQKEQDKPVNEGRHTAGEVIERKEPTIDRSRGPIKMPRWLGGKQLQEYLDTDLKPAEGKQESKEFIEFREAVEKLARAENDPKNNDELLAKEHVDLYDKSKAYLASYGIENEPPGRKGLADNVVKILDREGIINKYNRLKDKDLSNIVDFEQRLSAELNAPMNKKLEEVAREKAEQKLEKERMSEGRSYRRKNEKEMSLKEEMSIGAMG